MASRSAACPGAAEMPTDPRSPTMPSRTIRKVEGWLEKGMTMFPSGPENGDSDSGP